MNTLLKTPLHASHLTLQAKMCPFAGYDMPVQYPDGILKEHLWTREHCGLFDVSHMGQAFIVPQDGRFETAAAALERLVPADILGMKPGMQRYGLLLNEAGGIVDDLMLYRSGPFEGGIFLVVNASRKDVDYAHIAAHLPVGVALQPAPNRALLALQGPQAEAVLAQYAPQSAALTFLTCAPMVMAGHDSHVARAGYTGEDGFEISLATEDAVSSWALLLADERVRPIGLGARDSLRLEAGLCLYGHELEESLSPVEAALSWAIPKRRREQGGFLGYERLVREWQGGVKRIRIGLRPEGRAPAREGTKILSQAGEEIGLITSGGFGPSVQGPVAMGYIDASQVTPGSSVQLAIRDRQVPAQVTKLPFIPHRYKRG
jgi:aminomethyltransferase